MIDRVKRILNIKELQANVKEFKVKEEKKRKAEIEKNLLEINDFLMATQNEIINASKKGEVSYSFQRYEDGHNRAYISEIEYFFKSQGLDVDIVTSYMKNYSTSDMFFGFGSFNNVNAIKYTFVISWRE